MRQDIFIAGIAIIIVGVLVAGGSFTQNSESTVIPQQGVSCLSYTPPIVGGGTATFAWSGAGSGFHFIVAQQSGGPCGAGTIVANVSGSSGSVSFSVTGGVTYIALGTGNTVAVPVTVTVSGITPLLLGGIVVAVVGAGLAFAGYVMKDKPRRARAPPPAPRSILPPLPRQEGEVPVGVTPSPTRTKAAVPEPSGPVYFKPSGPEQLYGANDTTPAPKAPGNRPPIKCASCGTMNEPWLHNCRWCKRPLESTGT